MLRVIHCVMLAVMICACWWVLCHVFVCLVCDLPCDGGWCVCLCVCFVRCVCFLVKLCLCVLCVSYNVTLYVVLLVFDWCLRLCAIFYVIAVVLFLMYWVVVYVVVVFLLLVCECL